MTDVLMLEDLEPRTLPMVVAAVALAGYKTDGPPPTADQVLAFFPATKKMRAAGRDAEFKNDSGKVAVVKKVTPLELVSTLRGMAEAELADSMTGAAMSRGTALHETIEKAVREEGEFDHSEKFVLENTHVKIMFCVNCARKFALGEMAGRPKDAELLKDFSQPEVIRLLVGTLLNYEGKLRI